MKPNKSYQHYIRICTTGYWDSVGQRFPRKPHSGWSPSSSSRFGYPTTHLWHQLRFDGSRRSAIPVAQGILQMRKLKIMRKVNITREYVHCWISHTFCACKMSRRQRYHKHFERESQTAGMSGHGSLSSYPFFSVHAERQNCWRGLSKGPPMPAHNNNLPTVWPWRWEIARKLGLSLLARGSAP